MVYIYAKQYCTTCMSTVVSCVSIYNILLCATRYLQTLITRLTPRPPIQIPMMCLSVHVWPRGQALVHNKKGYVYYYVYM